MESLLPDVPGLTAYQVQSVIMADERQLNLELNKDAWVNDFHYRVNLKMESIAGYGSSLGNVHALIRELPNIFVEFNIKSMMDVPCGDYFWMNRVPKDGVQYIGGDLVDEQVEMVRATYPHLDVRKINLITDTLPKVDLIFVRDCFIHLPFEFIQRSLKNCVDSGSTYLMASSCPEVRVNDELGGVIGWRPLSLEQAPFNLPTPLKVVSEEHDYNPEKCMCIWKLSDVF